MFGIRINAVTGMCAGIVLAVLLIVGALVNAQDKNKAVKNQTMVDSPGAVQNAGDNTIISNGSTTHAESVAKTNPLVITPEEQAANKAIMAKFTPYQQKLAEYWNQILSTSQDDDAKVLNLVLKAKLVNSEAAAKINPELNAWFLAAQKAHNCLNCDIDNWVFTPKPMAGETPSATPAPKP